MNWQWRTDLRAWVTQNNRDYWFGLVWCILNAIAIVTDLILVETGHTSISMWTWIQTELHPTLIAAGVIFGLGIARLVKRYWWMVIFTGIMIGHLFIHW